MSISHHKILICDRGGQPHHWATWEDSICLKYKNLLSYEIGDASVFRGGYSRMTGEQSRIDIGQILFLKEALKYDARVPPLTNQNLFSRDRHMCMYCGRHYAEAKLSRDHIIPVSRGGQNTWTNCITSCKICNNEKDNRTPQEAGMALLAIPYTPSHAERLIMQNRTVLHDQMEYLKSFLPAHSRLIDKDRISRLS